MVKTSRFQTLCERLQDHMEPMKGKNVIADKDSVESKTKQNASKAVYGRNFDEDVEQNETNTCPECGGRVTTNVKETVCDDCGLVIDEQKMDLGPDWGYSEHGEADNRRAGAPNTVTRHDRGIGTNIGLHRDANGRSLSGSKRRKLGRMRREHRRAKFESKAERNRMKAFMEIRRMTSALGLSKSVREQTCQLFRTAQDRGLLRGRSIEAIAAGCVYAVCRINEHPRTFGDIETVAVVSKARIENGYGVLNRKLGLPVPPAKPKQYLPKVASEVEVDAKTERRARELIEQADAKTKEGVHPGGVVAGALYQAGKQTGERMTQAELAEAAEVSAVTVRERWTDLA